MYALSHQAPRNALTVSIEGFWSLDTFFAFQRDVVDQVRRITLGGKRHVVMVNVSKTALQTQEVIRHLQTLIESEQPQPRKIAFVATTALSRMQARRLLLRDNIKLFEDVAAAEHWLDETAD